MDRRRQRKQKPQYTPEAWRNDELLLAGEDDPFTWRQRSHTVPDVRDQTRLLELLGRINYKILTGNRVYLEVGGVVYRTLYGGYWRSVFTGVEHYLLRCEEVSGFIWTEGSADVDMIDLSIAHTKDGWTANGHSLMFMMNRD